MVLPAEMSAAVAFVATFVIIFVLSSVAWRRHTKRKTPHLPPGPRAWPVFGNLGLLSGTTLPPHRALAALAARHGPLMHLRVGPSKAVGIASSAETARLVLKTHDAALADRPTAWTCAGSTSSCCRSGPAGRRMCPGYGLAMKEVAGTLANLLLGFAWRLPDGTAPEDLSMEEFFGMSVRRATPLVAVAEPRLPARLYTAAAEYNI